MTLGADRKKVAWLCAVIVIGGGTAYYVNLPDSPQVEPRKTARPAANAVAPVAAPPAAKRGPARKRGAAAQDFKPTLALRPEDRPNYSTIDPTLRLDLLTKVQSVAPEGGSRSLFQFATAPAPPKPAVDVAAIHPAPRMYGPELPPKPAPPVQPPPPPPPPPITLKFYGYSRPKAEGLKRAFFMDGDEIYVAGEGELVKKRYRVVRIDSNSVLMEDTQFKNNRQTLPLTPEATSG